LNLGSDGLLGELAHSCEEEALLFGELREGWVVVVGQAGKASGIGVYQTRLRMCPNNRSKEKGRRSAPFFL
jgi:hypothetical protein